MNRLIFLLCLWLLLITNFSYSAEVQKNIQSKGESVLGLCVDETERLLGVDFLIDADRAYINIFQRGFDLSFTHGEVGTFGKRSTDYRMILACGVSGDKVVF